MPTSTSARVGQRRRHLFAAALPLCCADDVARPCPCPAGHPAGWDGAGGRRPAPRLLPPQVREQRCRWAGPGPPNMCERLCCLERCQHGGSCGKAGLAILPKRDCVGGQACKLVPRVPPASLLLPTPWPAARCSSLSFLGRAAWATMPSRLPWRRCPSSPSCCCPTAAWSACRRDPTCASCRRAAPACCSAVAGGLCRPACFGGASAQRGSARYSAVMAACCRARLLR